MSKQIIEVQGSEITIITRQQRAYISLTDIAKYKNRKEPFSIINNWMRNRSTIEFLGLWEKLSNPDFKPVEFERFRKDIAFEFASWISPEFKLYLTVEFQRLKDDENQRLRLEWNLQRTLAKINYRIHTDAIKEKIIPDLITKEQASSVYANEADMLNVALFGLTAKEWRNKNPGLHSIS